MHRPWKQVLVCCDSFKGTLTACDAGCCIERALRSTEKKFAAEGDVKVVHCPMSDGGTGLLESLLFSSSSYHFERVEVPLVDVFSDKSTTPLIIGPLGEPLNTGSNTSKHRPYFACDLEHSVVVVEMNVAAGLPMVSEGQRNPLHTTSYGVGQLIMYAVRYVAETRFRMYSSDGDGGVTVFLGIGGSATNDGGLGALQALGVELLVSTSDDGGTGEVQLLTVPFTGNDLQRLAGVRFTSACRQMFFRAPDLYASGDPYCKELRLICDVINPLVGPHGATAVFGPQKCNSSWTDEHRGCVLSQLERGMLHAATAVVRSRPHGGDIREEENEEAQQQQLAALCSSPGGGGAGGMSGFFRYLLRAFWTCGADLVAELLGLPEELQRCDCVITGEGSFDEQTIRYNKTVGRLLQMIVLENTRRHQADTRWPLIQDVIVVCGRTSYRDGEEAGRGLLEHMWEQVEGCNKDGIPAAIPKIHLLPLVPDRFSVDEALTNTSVCVEKCLTSFLSAARLH